MSKKNILIGSRALAYWIPSFKLKPNADWDVISTTPIDGTEWHDRYLLNNDDLSYYTNDDHIIDFNGYKLHVLDLRGLSLVKRSHLHRDLGFDKHITHYHRYLSIYADEYTHDDWNFLSERIDQTKIRFPKGNPNLMQSKEDFFDDYVDKKYDHDYLHTLVAFDDSPVYTKMLRDPKLAWCEKEKWLNLIHRERINAVAEETLVIALERFMVPSNWKHAPKHAYMKALKKVCTTLCSGWFRDFAIDNYPEIVGVYNENVFNHVKGILK